MRFFCRLSERIFFSFLFFPLGSFASAKSVPQGENFFIRPDAIREAAYSNSWLKLLHYKKRFFGGYQSEVVTRDFFLTQTGRDSPEDEIRKALEEIKNAGKSQERFGPLRQSFSCAFPARSRWLRKYFELPNLSEVCGDFEEWRRGIQAQSVSLVYSSAYSGNPASMFGHTLIRLNRSKPGEELLSYGVNYSAQITENENPVKYALFGLFGGYTGRFDLAPYHRKVSEYAVSESRDLWEYELDFSIDEVEMLIEHLWELYTSGGFKYFFLTRNCSYQVLGLLEAIRPDSKLTRKSGWWYVLPSDTIKPLSKGISSESITLRHSLKAQVESSYVQLSKEERLAFSALVNSPEGMSLSDSPTTALGTARLYLNYQIEAAKGASKISQLKRRKLEILDELNKREDPHNSSLVVDRASNLVESVNRRPDLSHQPMRILFEMGHEGGSQSLSGQFAFFAHDLLNAPNAYQPFSEIKVGELAVKYSGARKEFGVYRFEPLTMESYDAWDSKFKEFSWRIRPRWTEEGWKLGGGYGLSFGLWNSAKTIFYTLVASDVGRSRFSSSLFSVGTDVGLVIREVFGSPINLDYRLGYRAFSAQNAAIKNSFTNLSAAIPLTPSRQNLELRMGYGNSFDQSTAAKLQINYMF